VEVTVGLNWSPVLTDAPYSAVKLGAGLLACDRGHL
jgi:hypothetical protein